MTDASIASSATVPAARWAGSAISWSAIFAGAFAALGLSIVLIILGSAFGFGAMSPFADDGLSLTTIGVVTVLWLILTQIFASIAGGYIAGRMRTRWTIHKDEVFFRDTVHGFLTWALASAFVFAVAGLAAGGGAASATAVTAAAIEADEGPDPAAIIADRLYRTPGADPFELTASRGEVLRLFVLALDDEAAVTAEDRAWLADDVAARTGMPVADAYARVETTFEEIAVVREEARDAVDTARAAAATLAIATALAMMIGAFVASAAAVYGGRERDGLEDRLTAS